MQKRTTKRVTGLCALVLLLAGALFLLWFFFLRPPFVYQVSYQGETYTVVSPRREPIKKLEEELAWIIEHDPRKKEEK